MKKAGGAGRGKQTKTPKSAAGHKLAPAMPEGTVLTDLQKRQWRLGRSIGSGGFGLIYLTNNASDGAVGEKAEYCMKLEPFDNGPLFCELHFYQRAAQANAINEWMKAKSLKTLGIPRFVATGNHERDGKKYRFMVMQRFGTDLQKLFEANGKRFPTHSVFQLGLKLLNVFEYLHEKGYVHADIKASNLLTGFKDPQEAYLIDYGLAFRYTVDGRHKEYKEDPRRAHDGTVEFTSRDAHLGVSPSRRADMEILGYCMLQWLCGELPWENNLNNKEYVRDAKIRYMKNVPSLVSACFTDKSSCPNELQTYLQLVAGMQYEEQPDYARCRQLFGAVVKRLGYKESGPLDFSLSSTSKKSATTSEVPQRAGHKRQLASPVSPRTTSPDVSPPKSRRMAATSPVVSARGRHMDGGSDTENDVKTANQGKQKSPVPVVRKRVWPKAKVTSSESDTSSPLTIAKAKLMKQEVTASSSSVTPKSLSPVHIARQKNKQSMELEEASNGKSTPSKSSNGKSTPSKSSNGPPRKVVVRRRKNVQTATQGTQVTPGLKKRR